MLKDEEQKCIERLSDIYMELVDIMTDGLSKPYDTLEVTFHIHALQNMVMAQSAARAYPDKYRLLGG